MTNDAIYKDLVPEKVVSREIIQFQSWELKVHGNDARLCDVEDPKIALRLPRLISHPIWINILSWKSTWLLFQDRMVQKEGGEVKHNTFVKRSQKPKVLKLRNISGATKRRVPSWSQAHTKPGVKHPQRGLTSFFTIFFTHLPKNMLVPNYLTLMEHGKNDVPLIWKQLRQVSRLVWSSMANNRQVLHNRKANRQNSLKFET